MNESHYHGSGRLTGPSGLRKTLPIPPPRLPSPTWPLRMADMKKDSARSSRCWASTSFVCPCSRQHLYSAPAPPGGGVVGRRGGRGGEAEREGRHLWHLWQR